MRITGPNDYNYLYERIALLSKHYFSYFMVLFGHVHVSTTYIYPASRTILKVDRK